MEEEPAGLRPLTGQHGELVGAGFQLQVTEQPDAAGGVGLDNEIMATGQIDNALLQGKRPVGTDWPAITLSV